MAAITAPFPQNMTGSPFSYGMPGFGTSTVLSSSTLQTLGLGVGSSNAPLQGSIGGTSAPFIAFPYDGGHIPPSSPSLSGVPQHSVGPNINLFGVGSQALPPYNMSVGSTPFSLFDTFGNNTFSSAVIFSRGKPQLWTTTSCTGYYSCTGGTLRNSFLTRILESMVGTSPLARDVDRGKPFPYPVEPQARPNTYARRIIGGNPSQNPWNAMQAQPFTSYYGNQQMMSQKVPNPYAGHGHGYYQSPGQ
jgi:hypothetical protein